MNNEPPDPDPAFAAPAAGGTTDYVLQVRGAFGSSSEVQDPAAS
eukprot:gene7562-7065_t